MNLEEAGKATGVIRVLMVISCICMIILGIFLFFTPRYIIWLFLGAVTVRGIALIIKYFMEKEGRNGWDIVNGILFLIFGIWMITGNVETRAVALLGMEIFLAIWMIVTGISNIITAFIPKKRGEKSWVWFILGGVLSVICGIALLAFPVIGSVMSIAIVGIFAGVMLVIYGITGIAAALTKVKPTEVAQAPQEETPA